MIDESEKTIRHTGSKVVKEENINGKVGITSKTTLNATQTITHKFRLNSGQIVSIPVEIPTDPKKTFYDWSK